MKQTLAGPSKIDVQDNGRYAYKAPIWQIFYDRNGYRHRREYDFEVVTRKSGLVITAYGHYRRTVRCQSVGCR